MGATEKSPILVFLGSTLPLPEAQAELDAIYLQPAAQGDIVLAAHAFRPKAMVLIDGQFEDRPAVRHKEILWAMAQGIVMIGAASVGALRAAELQPFGMVGVGLIYRWYRRWPLAPDDAVAVQCGPPELHFLPLTDALVDLQRTFSNLMRRNLITRARREYLSEIAKSTNFRDRSLQAVLYTAGFPEDQIARLRREIVSQKRLDALLALRQALDIIAKVDTSRLAGLWASTNTFVRDLEAAHIDTDLIRIY